MSEGKKKPESGEEKRKPESSEAGFKEDVKTQFCNTRCNNDCVHAHSKCDAISSILY